MRAITIPEGARQQLSMELERWFQEETGGSGELSQAEVRLVKLERVEKNLQRLVIEEEISFEDFKEHRARLEAERARLRNLVEAIRSRQHLVRGDFEIALQLTTELGFLFDKGNFDERRLLCEIVFKRVHVKGGNITRLELNPPFSLIAARAEGSESFLSGEPDWKHSELCFGKPGLGLTVAKAKPKLMKMAFPNNRTGWRGEELGEGLDPGWRPYSDSLEGLVGMSGEFVAP